MSQAARAICGGGAVVLVEPVGHADLGEDDLVGAEGVGLDGVAAGGEERFVDLPDDSGRVKLRTSEMFSWPSQSLLQVERAGLQVGAHRAVEDDDASLHQVQEGLPSTVDAFLWGGEAWESINPSIRMVG